MRQLDLQNRLMRYPCSYMIYRLCSITYRTQQGSDLFAHVASLSGADPDASVRPHLTFFGSGVRRRNPFISSRHEGELT